MYTPLIQPQASPGIRIGTVDPLALFTGITEDNTFPSYIVDLFAPVAFPPHNKHLHRAPQDKQKCLQSTSPVKTVTGQLLTMMSWVYLVDLDFCAQTTVC